MSPVTIFFSSPLFDLDLVFLHFCCIVPCYLSLRFLTKALGFFIDYGRLYFFPLIFISDLSLR